jgi:LuxR family transcriptional regulator, maltose regulon positive regulatory protein
MTGPLCDAVLEQTGGAATRESLRRSNRFVVSLDEGGERYRYHHLFRALLEHELEVRGPGLASTLKRRAARWCEDNGEPETAIEYAFAGGDLEHVGRLLSSCVLAVYQSGRLATAQAWIERLEHAGELERYPAIAVFGAYGQGFSGHPAEAERLAAVAERGSAEGPLVDGSATIEPWVATLRAALCRHGVEQMRADAQRAIELAHEWSFWQSSASLFLGISFVLSGDSDRADELLADAAEVSRHVGHNAPIQLRRR